MKIQRFLLMMILFLIFSIGIGKTFIRNGVDFIWDYDLNPVQYDVARVVGHLYGDTIRVQMDGKVQTITLLGVQTPDNPNAKHKYTYFSTNAAEFTKQLCPYNSTVYLTYDQTGKDKYNRRLAYLWYKLKDQWVMHNLNLIANGYATFSDVYSVNESYKAIFLKAEEKSKNDKLGLWKKETEKENIEIVMSSSSDMVRIASVKYSGKPRYIEIKNVGSRETNLNRWFLLSVSSKRIFAFDQTIIRPYDSIKVYFESDQSDDFFWEGEDIFNTQGDGVILYNEKGKQVSIYTWGY
ncbi:MAG: thermonuclease family protein [Thermotogota bacterium]